MDANKQYLTTKIDPILEPLITQILLERPADLIDYILKFLDKMQKKPAKSDTRKAAANFESKADQSQSSHKSSNIEKASESVSHIAPKTATQKERIRQLLKNLFLFRVIPNKDLDALVDAMEEKFVSSGTTIIRQGDEPDNFYIVDSGKLECIKVSVLAYLISLGR
jgi:cAMP-dependent protein kinase regulator